MENGMNEKPYKLRALCADDIFPMCSIVNQIGFSEFKECIQSKDTLDMVRKIAAEASETKNENGKMLVSSATAGIPIALNLAGIVISNMEKCKDSLYSFLSDVSGLSKEEIKKLPMATFMDLIVDVTEMDDFKDFFKAASRLFK